METITDRFKAFYASLEKSGDIKNQADFASIIGVSTSTITEIFENRSGAGMKTIQKTVLAYKHVINSLWLLTGEGKMLIKDSLLADKYDLLGDAPEIDPDKLVDEYYRRKEEIKREVIDEIVKKLKSPD